MYEQQFGLSGPPFQLNPDPQFYFDSRGHSHALSYLKYGVFQGEGFIVVTGEIGAGKTTLVRTLLSGLDSNKVVAAQVVSTQLESSDLLHAIIAAFGIKPQGGGKAQALATLEAFLTLLASQQRRALLIVDEAQNLNREAIEELRMLSNFQIGHHALLQSFLVGQPELRRILESPSMEQLRQRVIASCHLGPLDAGETRSYIEHRLKRVGWSATPAFAEGSFEVIHQVTGGIPRRINLLCNRLFLGAFLSGDTTLTPDVVRATSRELRSEVGESGASHTLLSGSRSPAPSQPSLQVDLSESPLVVANSVLQRKRTSADTCIVALVDTRTEYLKACIVQGEFARQQLNVGVAVVSPYEESDVAPTIGVASQLALPAQEFHLRLRRGTFDAMVVEAAPIFAKLFTEQRPAAVCAFGSSDVVHLGVLLARKMSIPIVRLDAGQRVQGSVAGDGLNAIVLDRLADSRLTTALTAHYTLYSEGISSASVVCCGSLMADVARQLEPALLPVQEVLDRVLGAGQVSAPEGLVLVNSLPPAEATDLDALRELVTPLVALARRTPLFWLADVATMAALEQFRLLPYLHSGGVHLLPVLDDLQRLSLLCRAQCLVSLGSQDLLEAAASLGVARVVLGRGNAGPDPWGSVFAGLNAKRLLDVVDDALRARQSPEGNPGVSLAAPLVVSHLRTILRQGTLGDRRQPGVTG